MRFFFARSAGRHGIDPERAGYVIEHCPAPLYASGPGRQDVIQFLGPDQHGVPLEVAAVELADGDLLVIHAMRLRRAYASNYEKVMRWYER
jgi:hypothetical protein